MSSKLKGVVWVEWAKHACINRGGLGKRHASFRKEQFSKRDSSLLLAISSLYKLLLLPRPVMPPSSRHHGVVDGRDELHAEALRDAQHHHPVLDGRAVQVVHRHVLGHGQRQRVLLVWHLGGVGGGGRDGERRVNELPHHRLLLF